MTNPYDEDPTKDTADNEFTPEELASIGRAARSGDSGLTWQELSAEVDVDVARGIAEQAHTGQLDKIGAPYIQHPAMVANLVQRLPDYLSADPDTQRDAVVAAWLHDVLEDSPTTADDLRQADLPERAVDAVVALTRTDDVADDDYYATITTKPVALLVKTADLASNLAPHRVAQLDDATRTRLDARYTHALAQLGVPRDTINALHR